MQHFIQTAHDHPLLQQKVSELICLAFSHIRLCQYGMSMLAASFAGDALEIGDRPAWRSPQSSQYQPPHHTGTPQTVCCRPWPACAACQQRLPCLSGQQHADHCGWLWMHMLDQCPSWLYLSSYLHACTVHVLPARAEARPKVKFDTCLKSMVSAICCTCCYTLMLHHLSSMPNALHLERSTPSALICIVVHMMYMGSIYLLSCAAFSLLMLCMPCHTTA